MTQTPQEWLEESLFKTKHARRKGRTGVRCINIAPVRRNLLPLKGFLKLTPSIGSGISCLFCMRPNGGGDILMEVIGRGSLFLIL